MSQKDSQQQEPFWPRVKKRLKAKSKKKNKKQIKEEVNYALEVSAIGKSETVLKIFSIEAIKPAEIVEIEDQKELLNLKSLQQQQRSWSHKLKSFSLPKVRNGKVTQDPHKSLVERNDSKEKEQSMEFHKKVKTKGASAPCTPQRNSGNSIKTPFHAHFDTTTPRTNSRINHLPAPQCLCDEIAQDESRQQPQDNDGVGVSSSRSIVTISLSVLAVIMGCLAFSDRLVAVLCACLCWYLLPNFTKLHHHTASPTTLSNNTQRTNDGGTKSMKIDLNKSVSDISNSKGHQKKVIMAGLLHRPRC